MTTKNEPQTEIDEIVEEVNQKFNPYHVPAGSPQGGQFTNAAGATGGAFGKGVKIVSAAEEKNRVKAAGDAAAEKARKEQIDRHRIYETASATEELKFNLVDDKLPGLTSMGNERRGIF